ncbi:complex I NDUFA9 subunit family protein [Candidatus Pelagibacter bacterium]|nr:complex I NDUFA9 subunit family protein [Pelagibacteraceae bacterium]MDA8676493.1 complex I NDUFA9 subunit family protein [Candidatus Pelagibacter bacterium]MDA8764023.1 complex I NDUFA9 subunit family protein [Candidatus Pelagibacter bacterium]
MKNQICTILGGGGFIGRYLVRNLTKKNYRCIISTRKPFQKGYLKTQATPGAVELINWDTKNFSELKEAIKNSDIVINLVGILYETRKQKFYNIHSGIPEAVSKICSESDVKKFIHVSAIGANESSKSLYQKSKHQGEVKALNNFKNTVIIRPSVVCGAEDNFTNLFSKLSFLPVIPVVGINYNFQPILVTDVADAIVQSIDTKGNEGKIYEIGGPKVISFGDMVKSILKTINKKRFVVQMPMPIAKIQSAITDLLPIPPILTKDQCEILSEADNVVSNNHLTLKDLDINPTDVEEAMKKWLWRYKDGGQFAKAQ